MANCVTCFISGVNFFLKAFNIYLIETIGLEREDTKTMTIMKLIFFSTFVNSGIMLLFTNANLEYSILSFIPIRNQYADLDQDWYADIGPSIV